MKCLERNKQRFYFAPYLSEEPILDERGRRTGENRLIYGNPKLTKGNISSAEGETLIRQFGKDVPYDKVIAMDKALFDEYAVLWVDSVPDMNYDGTLKTNSKGEVLTPNDYIVKRVAKSKNSVLIAISKVNVRG